MSEINNQTSLRSEINKQIFDAICDVKGRTPPIRPTYRFGYEMDFDKKEMTNLCFILGIRLNMPLDLCKNQDWEMMTVKHLGDVIKAKKTGQPIPVVKRRSLWEMIIGKVKKEQVNQIGG